MTGHAPAPSDAAAGVGAGLDVAVEGLGVGNLALFNLALFFAVAAPGPAFLLCAQASLTSGRLEGVMVGLGLAVVAGLWTLAALAGLDALFDAVPAAYTGLRLAGAALVLVFAVQIWRDADSVVKAAAPRSRGRAFLRGAALNLANPKSIIFSAGVLLVIFPPGLAAAEMAVVTANHILLEVVVYAGVATALATEGVRWRYLAFKPVLSRVMAIVLAGLGLRLLATG